jgi:hypothetical protein
MTYERTDIGQYQLVPNHFQWSSYNQSLMSVNVKQRHGTQFRKWCTVVRIWLEAYTEFVSDNISRCQPGQFRSDTKRLGESVSITREWCCSCIQYNTLKPFLSSRPIKFPDDGDRNVLRNFRYRLWIDVVSKTIKFVNSPPCACRGSSRRHIGVSQLCCCWSMAVSFWVASIIVWMCFDVPSRECRNKQ